MGYVQRLRHGLRERSLDQRFLFWCMLLVVGFAYVAAVLCNRPTPFESRHGGYLEFMKLLCVAPFLFVLGPRHALTALDHRWRHPFLTNALLYAVPFFIALNWFFLQKIHSINYDLTPNQLAHMKPAGIAAFSFAALFLFGLAIYHARLARREGIFSLYAGAFFSIVGILAAVSYLIRNEHPFHIHHYFLFGFFIPFARFKTPLSVVCQAFCAGVFVEGISEWSMAPIWA